MCCYDVNGVIWAVSNSSFKCMVVIIFSNPVNLICHFQTSYSTSQPRKLCKSAIKLEFSHWDGGWIQLDTAGELLNRERVGNCHIQVREAGVLSQEGWLKGS